MAASKLTNQPKVARDLSGPGRLPLPQNLINKTPEDLVRTLNRFGIDPDLAGIDARGKRALAKFDQMLEEGVMPDAASLEALEKQNAREFEQNLRQMAKGAIRLYRADRLSSAVGEGGLLVWITSGRGSCPSCSTRHGVVHTLKEWRQLGLPGSVALICKSECNCQVVPAS